MIGGRTELPEVSGTGITEVVPNLPKCCVPTDIYRTELTEVQVPVWRSYRTIPDCSVGY